MSIPKTDLEAPKHLITIPFALFELNNWDLGPLQPPSNSPARPGIYVMASPDPYILKGINLIDPAIGELIRNVPPECVKRVRERDQRCLITGAKVTALNEHEFTVVNIARPDNHPMWHSEMKGLPTLKDPHTDLKFAHLSKKTIRNAFLVRSDVAEAWKRGIITVDIKASVFIQTSCSGPCNVQFKIMQQDYAIMAFQKPWQHLHGRKLYLEHLKRTDGVASTPLDAYFDEHKISAVAMQVLGK
ncbi:hypothetical protein Clacol_004815 [Clathrus columnatus]|uniref:Vitellogenin n=1 Tax=Clathrus columnatus TaxID=1419009 RepID=A0AAV5AD68_9AGAM|nr:hypothetical protein Clacol_004815 [Clathrus columnatus]